MVAPAGDEVDRGDWIAQIARIILRVRPDRPECSGVRPDRPEMLVAGSLICVRSGLPAPGAADLTHPRGSPGLATASYRLGPRAVADR